MVAERFTLFDDAELKKTTNPQLVKSDREQDFVIAIEDTGLKKMCSKSDMWRT